jgi:hypothetical protein
MHLGPHGSPHHSLEATKRAKEAHMVVFSHNRKTSFLPLPLPTKISLHATPHKI